MKRGKILWSTIVRFGKDRCDLHARSLSYLSLLSLVPILIIIVLELKNLAFFPMVEKRLMELIYAYFLPQKASVISERIQFLLEDISVGFFGVIFSIVIGFLLFFSISKTVNSIWRWDKGRSLLWSTVKFFIALVSVPPILISAFFFRNILALSGIGGIPVLSTGVEHVVSIFLHWIVLVLVCQFIPHGRVNIFYSLLSGCFGGTIWYGLRIGLNLYVHLIPQLNLIYGSLAFVPILLIWLYASWAIALFALELNYTLHYNRRDIPYADADEIRDKNP